MSSQIQWTDFKERVRSATDLVSLIGEVVTLQPVRGGQEFIGLCPFHDDHTPSFRVYPDRQSFRCWACQAGGDCYTFVTLRERVGFREALELLADRARIEMPKFDRREGGYAGEGGNGEVSKPQLFEVLAWAEQLYHDCLLHDPVAQRAREYFASRHLSEETIREFRLGYHPDDRKWLVDKARHKFPLVQLQAARLIGKNEDWGTYYDEIVDRVMFPIHDAQGRTVSFGGRVLPGSDVTKGKYKNGSESAVFTKSRVIFGLNRARQAIIEQDLAVVVEGYMDCIAAHQSGLTNVVASMGTALTEQQVTTLKRLTPHCVLMYDGDEAGLKAMEKSLPRFMAQELDLRLFILGEGLDPDDVVRERGPDWFREQLRQAPEPWEFKLSRVTQRNDIRTLDGAQRTLDEMLEVLCEVPTFLGNLPTGGWKLREDMLLGKLAQRLGLPERSVRDRLHYFRQERDKKKQIASTRTTESTPSVQAEQVVRKLMQRATRDEQIELELLQLVILNPEVFQDLRTQVDKNELTQPHLHEIWELCLKLSDVGSLPGYDTLLTVIEEPHLKQLLVWLDATGRQKGVSTSLIEHTLMSLRQRRVARQRAQLQDGGVPMPKTETPNADGDKMLLRRASELNQQRIERKQSL